MTRAYASDDVNDSDTPTDSADPHKGETKLLRSRTSGLPNGSGGGNGAAEQHKGNVTT